MAHIKLLDPFKKELRDMVVYTLAEFGATSVKRFNKELDDIKHRLMLHPLSSPREPLLKRFHRPYHSAIIKENWKIIYRYDEANYLSFSSQSHFIQIFEGFTGLTPKKYRDRYYKSMW